MKVLHIIHSLDPAHGGPPEAVRILIRNRPAGYENHAVTLDAFDDPMLRGMPFPVHALGVGSRRWGSLSLVRWLRQHRTEYDLILLHGIWGFTSIAVVLALVGRVPYSVFVHGMLDPYFKRRFPLKHAKKWIFWLLVQYWVLRFADHVLFTTELEKELAEKSFWLWHWNPVVIPYGADPPPFPEDRIRNAFLEAYPELRGERILLYLGRIDRKKGCDLLIKAFAALPAPPNGEAPLHLLMAGPDREDWQHELMQLPGFREVADRVHWTGMIRGDVKWGAFACCEAFVLPSHQENFGIAVAEALSYGCPVLITDKVNIWPEVRLAGAGLVEDDTQAGVDRLLRHWLEISPELKRAMSRHARALFHLRYDMKRNTGRLYSLLQQTPSATDVDSSDEPSGSST